MALRILPLSPLPTASFLNGRRNIIHNILLQFERKAVANRSSLSQSLQNDIAFLMNDWRAGYSIGPLDADVQDIPTLRVVTQAFNLTSAEYNRLDRLVDTAISSATPSPIPSPTPGPAPTPAERVARDAGKAVATGVAQGVGQIALVGVAVAGIAFAYFVFRRR